MATNYTGDKTATQAPSPAPGRNVEPVFTLVDDGDALNAASVAQEFKAGADFLAYLTNHAVIVDDLFGDGSDGAQASGFGAIALTRAMHYTNLTMAATDSIATAGFPIYVSGTFTAVAGAVVSCNASGQNAGGRAGMLGSGGDGGAAATAGTAANGGIGGAGGAGGGGGAGGTVTAPTWPYKRIPFVLHGSGPKWSANVFAWLPIMGGSGGGGGANGGGAGGVGGGGGGVVHVYARVVNATFTAQATGGNGANGAGGNADGGGGGGGGHCIVAYREKTALTVTMTTTAGTGGTAAGAGANGSNGTGGGGSVIEVQL